MAQADDLRKSTASFPDAAGVYIMKDASGKVIYVGKANSLKKRLSSYFGRDLATKTVMLMSHARQIEFRLTHTESLALLLEASLIHKFQPKYNVSLRDDKSFPFVKITNEDFPAVIVTRKKEDDGARYLGPYTSAKLLRQALTIIRRSIPYRSCREMPKKACIYYRLNLSPAPCIGRISKEEYSRNIESICLILDGRVDTLVERLSALMFEKAKDSKFEQAAALRDQIEALSRIDQSNTAFGSQEELEQLRKKLQLEKPPSRIEAFDISNLSGKEASGSMASFYQGRADKNNYRRFRIKTVSSADDYGMISEVVRRRYTRLKNEKAALPDLILIDGGRGHLSAAAHELEKLGLNIPLMSIAKERENIYVLGGSGPLRFATDAPGLNLIRRIRDEAHRFAVAYHHILRRKKIVGR